MACRSCAKRRAEREKLLKQRREAEARKSEAKRAKKKPQENIKNRWNVMAFKPLLPKTEYMRLPIPDYSEIKAPPASTVGIPVPGNPQPMEQYPRKQG